jgi:5-methylcytosine-specific restriction endonuclease McrA
VKKPATNDKKATKEPDAKKPSTSDKKAAKEPISEKTANETVVEKKVSKDPKSSTNTDSTEKKTHRGGKPNSKSVEEDSKLSKKTDEEQEQKRNKKDAIPKILKDLCWYTWIGKTVASHTCVCCERMEIRMNSFECGHVIAEAKGGQLSVENLRPICGGCNRSMGSENLEDFKRRCGFGELAKSEGVIKSDDKIGKIDIKKAIVEDTPNTTEEKTELPIAQPLHDRRKTIKQGIKRQVWDKHVGADLAKAKCPCCKHNQIDVNTFLCAHFKGESEGGILEVDNLRPICSTCDTDIETQSISEFMKTYNIK